VAGDFEKQDQFIIGNSDYNCPKNYEHQEEFFNDSSVTLNPWQDGTVGQDSDYADRITAEYIKISSPLMYARIVQRNINLEQIKLEGFSEADYLKDTGKIDELYEEGERRTIEGRYRIYGAYEIPEWAQELNKYGMAEQQEVTLNFNTRNLSSTLDGSVLHIGDVLQLFDTIQGWKYYEIMNALPHGNFLGQYLMWQVVAKKTDLEGYIDLETADLETHPEGEAPPVEETATSPSNKPRPKIY